MNDMNEKQTKNGSGRLLAVIVALALTVLVAAGSLLLSGCGKNRKTTSPETGSPSESETADPTKTPGGTETPSGTVTPTGTDVPLPENMLYSKKEGTVYFSPSSVAGDGEKLFVSDATNFAVYRLSSDGKVEKTVYFDATVSKVVLSGERVLVTEGELGGKLHVLDYDLNEKSSIRVGHTPTDIYVNGDTAYVCNRFSDTVSVVDLKAGKTVAGLPAAREPVCMAAFGDKLYVGCALQDGNSLQETLSSKITVIDMKSNSVTGTIALQDGAINVRGIAVSPDGKELYVTHTVGRYAYPTTILDRGWINSNGFSIVNTETGKAVGYLLDDVELGAGNPWDVAAAPDGRSLVFSIAGTDELISVDLLKLRALVGVVEAGKKPDVPSVEKIIDHLEFLSSAKKRVTLGGEGLRDIELVGDKLFVGAYFSGTILEIDPSTLSTSAVYPLGTQPKETGARTGEKIWYGAKFCYQQWESCSSCHADGRMDAINWDEEADLIGTPKNTKSMVFSVRTPPVLLTGLSDNTETIVSKAIRSALRSDITEEEVGMIFEYLRSLLPVESPYLNDDGSYTEAALRGKALFEEAGCAKCHPAPLYSDMKSYMSPYLGADGSWENRPFVTPTLVECWRSYPYNYAGSEMDMKELIKKFSNKELTESELSDLEQFVLSIGTVGEYYGVEEIFLTAANGKQEICKLTPGAVIDRVTVRKQIPSISGVADPVITAKLMKKDGSKVEEKTFKPGTMVYNTAAELDWGFKLPGSLEKGDYLEITITDAQGRALATAYKLVYNG